MSRDRLAAARAALAALATTLAGCGSMAIGVQDDWQAQPSHPPLPPFNVVVAAGDLPQICGDFPGKRLYGCAQRNYEANVCIIYTAARPAQWLLEHERKHCAGYDHGRSTLTTAAVR